MFVNRSFAGNIRFALSQKIRRIPCGFFDTTVIYNTSGTFPTNGVRSRTIRRIAPPCPKKNFPQVPAAHQSESNFRSAQAGTCGKFSEGEGGLEGEGDLFQEVSLPLQGLSLFLRKRHSQTVATLVVGMPRVPLYPNVGHPMPRDQRKKPLP